MRILIAGRGFDSLSRRETGAFEADQARALLSMGHDVRFAATDTRSIRRLRPPGLREYVLGGMKVVYCAIPAGAKPAFLSKKAQRSASPKAGTSTTPRLAAAQASIQRFFSSSSARPRSVT